MKITSGNLFSFGLEDSGQHEAKLRKAAGMIRSPIFKKYIESLNTKTGDQDYDRFLGLIDLISANLKLIPKQKKAFEAILGPDYLKGVDSETIRSKVRKDLFDIYEELKKAKMG